MPKLTANHLAALISVYFVVLGVLYSANTPPFEGPDELAHFVYINKIINDRAIPQIPDRATAFAERNYEVHQLPLYYIAGVPFAAPFDRSDIDNYFRLNPFASIGTSAGNNENVQLQPLTHEGGAVRAMWAVRLMSMGLGIATLMTVYHSGRLLGGDAVGLGALLLAVSIPTFIHISASVNNDNLNTLMVSLAVYFPLRTWRAKRITRWEMLVMSLALSAAAITKLTGLAAFAYVIGAHLLGWWRERFKRGEILTFAGVIVGVFAVVAGWWYVRSVILYGDPIAYEATMRLWGRGTDLSLFEVWGVWESFWMALGHLNVPGPSWFAPYATAATALGLIGAGVLAIREPERRWELLYLFLVSSVAFAAMLYITRRVNISQGRALFTALAALAPLLVMGWRTLLGRAYLLPILPLTVIAATVPFTALPRAFPSLETVERAAVELTSATPMAISRLDTRAESITVYGYDLHETVVGPRDTVTLDVYFTGGHPENPALFITAQHPVTGERIGTVDTYPGMAPTDALTDEAIYRARVRLPLRPTDTPLAPFQIQLAMGWRVPNADDPGQGRFLQWYDSEEREIGAVFFDGPTYLDDDYVPQTAENTLRTVYGENIALNGYTVAREGAMVDVTLTWEALRPIANDWTLTVALLDGDGELVAQDDAPPAGYPTSAWQPVQPFTTSHALTLPDDAPSEGLTLQVGWYNPDSMARKTLSSTDAGTAQDNLLRVALD